MRSDAKHVFEVLSCSEDPHKADLLDALRTVSSGSWQTLFRSGIEEKSTKNIHARQISGTFSAPRRRQVTTIALQSRSGEEHPENALKSIREDVLDPWV